MAQPTFFDCARGWVSGIAWRVFLWANHMTNEQYDNIVHAGCNPANGSPACIHGYNGLCHTCDAYNTPPERIENA